ALRFDTLGSALHPSRGGPDPARVRYRPAPLTVAHHSPGLPTGMGTASGTAVATAAGTAPRAGAAPAAAPAGTTVPRSVPTDRGRPCPPRPGCVGSASSSVSRPSGDALRPVNLGSR